MVPLHKKLRRLLLVFSVTAFTPVAVFVAVVEFQAQRDSLAQSMRTHVKVLRTLLENTIASETTFMKRFADTWQAAGRVPFNGFERELIL